MKLFSNISKITSHFRNYNSKYFGAMFQNGNVEVPQAKIFVIFFLKSLVYHIFENLTIRKFLRIR